MAELILHLGLPKTGTTSLQRALFQNRKYLLSQGIFYPVFPVSQTHKSHQVLQPLCNLHSTIQPYWRHNRSALDLVNYSYALYKAMLNDFRASGTSRLLISCEVLAGGAYFSDFVGLLKRDFDRIVPVLYVRDAVPHFRSLLQQRAKAGEFLHSRSSVKYHIQNLDAVFETPVRVYQYEESYQQSKWSITKHFAKNVLETCLPDDQNGDASNVADPAELTLVLLTVAENYTSVSGPAKRSVREIFERISYLRRSALELSNAGEIDLGISKLAFSEELNDRIVSFARDDRNFIESRLTEPALYFSKSEVPRPQNLRVLSDLTDLLRNSHYDKALAVKICDALLLWLDRVIAGGDASPRTTTLRAAVVAAQTFLFGVSK